MIVTAEQAAALPDPFVVDGDELIVAEGMMPGEYSSEIGPPSKWADLDRPCDTCGGDLVVYSTDWGDTSPCPICHGTGRHVEELGVQVAPCGYGIAWGDDGDCGLPECHYEPCRSEGGTSSLGLFTIQVLPIVRGACPDPTNAPHRKAHIHYAEADESRYPPEAMFGMCIENADLIWDSPWKNEIDLPPDACPGQYVVIPTKVEP